VRWDGIRAGTFLDALYPSSIPILSPPSTFHCLLCARHRAPSVQVLQAMLLNDIGGGGRSLRCTLQMDILSCNVSCVFWCFSPFDTKRFLAMSALSCLLCWLFPFGWDWRKKHLLGWFLWRHNPTGRVSSRLQFEHILWFGSVVWVFGHAVSLFLGVWGLFLLLLHTLLSSFFGGGFNAMFCQARNIFSDQGGTRGV
jgi:hypothetical protein